MMLLAARIILIYRRILREGSRLRSAEHKQHIGLRSKTVQIRTKHWKAFEKAHQILRVAPNRAKVAPKFGKIAPSNEELVLETKPKRLNGGRGLIKAMLFDKKRQENSKKLSNFLDISAIHSYYKGTDR